MYMDLIFTHPKNEGKTNTRKRREREREVGVTNRYMRIHPLNRSKCPIHPYIVVTFTFQIFKSLFISKAYLLFLNLFLPFLKE